MTSLSSPSRNAGTATNRARARRLRGKYSSKACIQCRNRKLKCSGDDPCQRCARGGQLCLFSDDPAVTAELLRQNELSSQRRASLSASRPDAQDQLTVSDMEARMIRIESVLSTLVERIPQKSDPISTVRQHNDENTDYTGLWMDPNVAVNQCVMLMANEGSTDFQAPIDTFNADVASLREHLGYQQSIPTSSWQHDGNDARLGSTPARTVSGVRSLPQSSIRFGRKSLPFPSQAEYTRYLDFVFEDINACHPCLNEYDFRSRCGALQTTRILEPADACLLATNYILFACTDILTHLGPIREGALLPGWQWYAVADELMAKRKITGRGDLSLMQFLVFEALYLIHADNANAAYNVSGLACRLCFQFGLHQQRLWGANCSPYAQHMRQRLFWTVYFVDRRISLSCGRPYGIRDSDIDVDQPLWYDDRSLHPEQTLPEPDPENSNMIYLACMIAFSRLGGEIWDQVFSVSSTEKTTIGERIAILDARIQYWLQISLPTMPLSPQNGVPSQRHLRQQSLARTRMWHLRLLLRRRAMVSLSYTASDGMICGQLAIDIVRDMQEHISEVNMPSSFRFHMATTLGGTIVVLATLLCRDIFPLGLQESRSAYAESYQLSTVMLRDLASTLHAAGRILEDLKDIINVVDDILRQNHSPRAMQNGAFMDAIPENIDHLFPSDPLAFNIHLMGDWTPLGTTAGNTERTGLSSALQHSEMTMAWDSWDDILSRAPNGYGVPWV